MYNITENNFNHPLFLRELQQNIANLLILKKYKSVLLSVFWLHDSYYNIRVKL